MAELRVASPETLEEALRILQDHDAMAVGGCTSVGILLRNGLLDVRTLVDLRHLALGGIDRCETGTIVIGGRTTLAEIARSEVAAGTLDALAQAAAVVGNPRVRALATLGGAMAHADPRQDVPPALLALGATVCLASARGEREVPVSRFFTGFMETECREDELVTRIRVDTARPCSTYVRFSPGSADDYPVVAAAAALAFDDRGRISSAGVALAGARPTAYVAEEAEHLLVGEVPSEELWRAAGDAARDASDPTGDHRGSAGYKRQMAGVVTERALRRATASHRSGEAPASG